METLTTTTIETIRHNDFAGIADTKETSLRHFYSWHALRYRKARATQSRDVVTRDAFLQNPFCYCRHTTRSLHIYQPDSKLESLFPARAASKTSGRFKKRLVSM